MVTKINLAQTGEQTWFITRLPVTYNKHAGPIPAGSLPCIAI